MKRGLAYSIYSALDPLRHAGLIIGTVATENGHVAQSIDIIRAEWRRMREEGPTAEELADAKTYLTGSFPLSLDSPAASPPRWSASSATTSASTISPGAAR